MDFCKNCVRLIRNMVFSRRLSDNHQFDSNGAKTLAHRVLLFAHPLRAESGRFNLENVQANLVGLGHHVEVLYSQANRRASIRQLSQALVNFDEVVVLGGDGTVNTAANALVHSDIIMTVLPTGSGNDYVRSIGRRKVTLADRLLAPATWVDVGEVNGDVFVNAAGLGFDVAVLERLGRRRPTGFAYQLAALAAIARFRPTPVSVYFGNRRVEQTTLILVVAKGRHFGGGIPIAQGTTLDNSRLRLAWSSHAGRWQRWPFLLRILAGRLPKAATEPPIIQQDISAIKITTPGHKMQLDGEVIQQTPAYIRVLPQALRVRTLAL